MADKVRNTKRDKVVKRLKAKFGDDIFKKWGWSNGRGGSPILKAYAAKKRQKNK